MAPHERPSGDDESLSVAAVARRLGVAGATLRTWDRRYGIGPSVHEAGEHRRYAPEDVERLVLMRRLTLEGVAPARAAQAALAGHAGPPPRDDGEPADAATAPPATVAAVAGRAAPSSSGETAALDDGATAPGSWAGLALERTPLTRRASPAGADALQRAALDTDADACAAIVAEAARRRGPLAAWEELVVPALHALGRRWEATSAGVDTDLVLRSAALAALRSLSAPPLRTSAVVVVAASEHETSSTVLHVIAAALRADGVRPWVLAAGLPREAVAAAVRRCSPIAVVLHAERMVTDAATQLAVLPRLRTPARLVLSGPGWSSAHLPDGRSALRATDARAALEAVAEATAP